MARSRAREPEAPPEKTERPKGSKRCICGASGLVAVINSKHQTPSLEEWAPGQRFNFRTHSHVVTCPCAVGQWLRSCHHVCPWPEYDLRFMVVADHFYKQMVAWERDGGDPPAVEVAVENLPENPGNRFDKTDEWLGHADPEKQEQGTLV